MDYKYGCFPAQQIKKFKKRIHSWVHWLLIYAEEHNNELNNYYEKVQYKIDGLNSLLNFPTQVIEIMALIESAKIEYNKPDYNHAIYRKIILDIHELIDRIPEGDE